MMTISDVESEGVSVVVPSPNSSAHEVLLDDKKYKEIEKNIKEQLEDLQKRYKEIEKINSPIVKKKFLGLINRTDVDESFEAMLAILQDFAQSVLKAFQGNSNNLTAILELMKLLISVDTDLYQRLEESDCSKENIANLLHDLCSQYNIDSSALEGLFEQSFRRTMTLRGRINDLKKEVFARISLYEEKFDNLDEMLKEKGEEVTSQFDALTAAYKEELAELVRGCLDDVSVYKREVSIVRNSYSRDLEILKEELVAALKKQNDAVAKVCETKFKDLDRKNCELKEDVMALKEVVVRLRKRMKWCFMCAGIAVAVAVLAVLGF